MKISRLIPTRACAAAAFTLLAAVPAVPAAQAAAVVFSNPPFEGSTADPNDNVRTIFGGNERFLPSFDRLADSFVFTNAAFNLAFNASGGLNFFSGNASALPPGGRNVIVLQDLDNDNNPATAFNAGAAANLIADAVTQDGAGFFVYLNSALGVNRLVYSTNLNSRTADLAILARIQSPSGTGAVTELRGFGAQNFAVPEPSGWALGLTGIACLAATRRRPRAAARA